MMCSYNTQQRIVFDILSNLSNYDAKISPLLVVYVYTNKQMIIQEKYKKLMNISN